MTVKRVACFGAIALCACATGDGAAKPAAPEAVTPRVLAHEVWVPASPERTFAAWSSEEGVRTFFAPAARIEARPGGPYELYFQPEAPEGSRGCDTCRVLEVDPPRHLSFSWLFPPSLPSIRSEETRVDVTFTPERDGTRVRLAHIGWREGEDWEKGYAYFDRAWALVLSRLVRSFESGPIDFSKE